MASVIKLKRSSSAGAVPAGSDLEVGEVAINLADRVIYSKQAGGAVVRIGEAALANTNAAIASVQSALDTQEAKQASNLANTNAFIASVQSSAGGGLGNTNLAIAQLNTNLTATNTAIRSLITSNDTDIATQAARVDLVNTNLTATNTAIRLLNTNTQSALDTQEAKQASNLANTNAYIAATQGNLDTQIASERAALANTNTRISNLSTTLSGDFLTKANPESSGLLAHTGRATISTNLSVAGNTHIDGNLTVEGEVTYISTTTLEVMDPLIKLASNNQTDAVDTGFYALYDEGSTAKYAGIFRDATDGVFKVFKDLQADPTVTVDTSGTGYAIGQLDAIVDGGSF